MSLQPSAKFDPSQAALSLGSSAGPPLLLRGGGPDISTAGPLDEQVFVHPSAFPSYDKFPSDFNALPLNETVLPDNIYREEGSPAPVVFLKRVPSIQDRFFLLQKWEGAILQVLEDSFLARLVDLTSGGPDEEAEFPLEEISEADRSLVEPGAIFYWSIGYIDSIRGQRTRASVIRFRRLPIWKPEELEKAKHRAQSIRDLLNWK